MENLTLEHLRIINDCLAASKYRYETDKPYADLCDYLDIIPIIIQAITDKEFEDKRLKF
jgi:hypothetical protein